LTISVVGFLITGCSKKGNPIEVITNAPPQPVTLTVADSTATSVDLIWSRNSDSDFAYYRLYRTNGYDSYLIKTINSQADTTYLDSILSPSHKYSYFVTVADTGNLVSQSNLDTVTTLGIAVLTLGMEPRYLEMPSGRTFTTEVWIENVNSLFGASFELAYDSISLVADSAKSGNFLGSDIVFFNHTEPGLASFSVTLKAGAAEISGNGSLAVVYFHSIGTGSKVITFSPTVALRRANGSDVTGFTTLTKLNSTLILQ
jgi:hypothetical protein